MQELESALAQQAPPQTQDDPTLHELPPLVIDGIPTPVEKMTQVSYLLFLTQTKIPYTVWTSLFLFFM